MIKKQSSFYFTYYVFFCQYLKIIFIVNDKAELKMRLLDQVRHVIRKKHYSICTEQAYTDWIKRFIIFHGKRHPKDMGEKEISEYISFLAVKRNVAASTQNQALNAIVFLYKQVLKRKLGNFESMERAKRPKQTTSAP